MFRITIFKWNRYGIRDNFNPVYDFRLQSMIVLLQIAFTIPEHLCSHQD